MKKNQKQKGKPALKVKAVRGADDNSKEPWYKNPVWWLVLLVCLLYGRTMDLGFTRLDDSIFIVENEQYNKGFDNVGTSFQRGLFNPT